MDDLIAVLASEDAQAGTRTMLGTVRTPASGPPVVTVGGSPIRARWLSGITAADTDTVLVQIAKDSSGQAAGLVLGVAMESPAPLVGTVTAVKAGVRTIQVKAGWMGEISAAYVTTYSPTVGDEVTLIWQGSYPIALGARSAKLPAGSDWQQPTPPPDAGTGLTMRAITSATWSEQTSTWDSYAASDLIFGPSARGQSIGLWAYGAAGQPAQGKTVSSVRVKVPLRLAAYGKAGVPVRAMLAPTEPLVERERPRLVTGRSMALTIPASSEGGWVDVPSGWGSLLAAGGGICVYDAKNYGGLAGIDSDPESGLVKMSW